MSNKNPDNKGNVQFIKARDLANARKRAESWKDYVTKLGGDLNVIRIAEIQQSTLDKLVVGDLSVDCVLAKRRVLYAINKDKISKDKKESRLAKKEKVMPAKAPGLEFAVGLRAELINLIRKNGPDKHGNPVPLATSAIARHIGLADSAVEAILASFGSDLVHDNGKWSIPVPKVVEAVKVKVTTSDDGKTSVHLRHLAEMVAQLSDKIDAINERLTKNGWTA